MASAWDTFYTVLLTAQNDYSLSFCCSRVPSNVIMGSFLALVLLGLSQKDLTKFPSTNYYHSEHNMEDFRSAYLGMCIIYSWKKYE